MANYVKGIGDALTGANEIMPLFDAKIFNYILQNQAGVIGGAETQRFNLTTIPRGVQIGAGTAQAQGYFAMSDSPAQLNFIYPSGSAQFVRVFAEINLAVIPHKFEIRATPQGGSTNITLIQDNLATSPNGIHQIPLYLLRINPNQTITIEQDQRNILNRLLNAQHALNADDATRATHLVAGGTIASTVTAITQAAGNNSAQVATTAFVQAAIPTVTPNAQRIDFVTTNPTTAPPDGQLQVAVLSAMPAVANRRARTLYLITI